MKKNSVVILSLLFVIAACSPKAEKKISVQDPVTGEKTNVTVSKDLMNNNVTIKSDKDGAEVQITNGKLAAGIPDYLKIYPGATKVNSIKSNKSTKMNSKYVEAYIITLESNDAPTKIIDFYKEIGLKNGMKSNGNMNMGPMSMESMANETSHQAMQIMATKEEGKATKAQIIFEKGE